MLLLLLLLQLVMLQLVLWGLALCLQKSLGCRGRAWDAEGREALIAGLMHL
jgi:hypothetical protein